MSYQMQHDVDPKDDLLKKLGDIKDIEIFHNQLLCAVYIRPEKTKSGIVLPDQHRAEDRFQGKIGLVLKKGPDAFVDANDHWVVFRPSDGWSVTINNVLCRILDDVNVRGRVKHPDQVW
jgi:co-chaperonin GroES (HSP10)